jgi:hypothetical protein
MVRKDISNGSAHCMTQHPTMGQLIASVGWWVMVLDGATVDCYMLVFLCGMSSTSDSTPFKFYIESEYGHLPIHSQWEMK